MAADFSSWQIGVLVVAHMKIGDNFRHVQRFQSVKLVTRFPTRSIGNTAKGTPYGIDIVDVTFDVKKADSLMNP